MRLGEFLAKDIFIALWIYVIGFRSSSCIKVSTQQHVSLGLETADLCVDVVQIFLIMVRGFCWRNIDGTEIYVSG